MLTEPGPECRNNKHPSCDGRTIDPAKDQIVECPCQCHGGTQ